MNKITSYFSTSVLPSIPGEPFGMPGTDSPRAGEFDARKLIMSWGGTCPVLQEMRDTLAKLANACDGNNRPHCPIIDELEGRN